MPRLLLFLALLCPLTSAMACVCRKTTLDRMLIHSTAVFVAEVARSQSRQAPAQLRVIEPIKGTYVAGSSVEVESQFGDCSAPDTPGARLLVFFDEFESDRRTISSCSAFLVEATRIDDIELAPAQDALDFLKTTARDYVAKKKARTGAK